jgi:hypothetical protein
MYANQQPATTAPDLLAAAGVFFPGATGITAIAGFPHQVLLSMGDREWAVRRWPEGATITSIEWIADALAVARGAGIDTVPEHAAVPGRGSQRALLHDGRLYDAVTWPTGRPLNRYGTFSLVIDDTINLPLPDSMAAPDILIAAVRELAQFHVATADVADRADAPVLTLASVLTESQNQYAALRKTVGQHAGGSPEIRRWLRCGNRILPAAAERLAEVGGLNTARSCAIHSDLWPSRLMIDDRDGNQVLTGITSWMQAAAGVPILDLARLAARCARWSAATTETVVGAYADISPLAPEQRRLLPVMAALDLTNVTGSMLQAAFDDDRLIADPVQAFIRSGIQTSLRSLETLANVLAPDERAAKTRSFHARPNPRGEDRPRRSPQPRNRRPNR